jgi:hypothetical protein
MNFISPLGRRPADRIVGVTPMNNVGTWSGRSVAAGCAPDAGEHRLRRRHCQSPSPECARSPTNALRSPLSAPHSWQITSAFLVVLRPMRLLAVRHLKRSGERCGVRARQHRQRGDTLWIAVGEQAAAPIMANQMKASLAMPGRRDDVERVADQPVDAVAVEVAGIGPGVDRITALVRRDR